MQPLDSVDRLRLGSLGDVVARSPRLGDSSGTVLVGRVCDGGLIPTAVPRVALVRPLINSAAETEGASRTVTLRECGVEVVFLGPRVPRPDDEVVARLIQGVWIAQDYGPASVTSAGCCHDACTLPATLSATFQWFHVRPPLGVGPPQSVCAAFPLGSTSATLNRVDSAGLCSRYVGTYDELAVSTADGGLTWFTATLPNKPINVICRVGSGGGTWSVRGSQPVDLFNEAGSIFTLYDVNRCSPSVAITLRRFVIIQGVCANLGPFVTAILTITP